VYPQGTFRKYSGSIHPEITQARVRLIPVGLYPNSKENLKRKCKNRRIFPVNIQ
jgi:hypothetical protein